MNDPAKHPAFEREAISPLMWSLLAAVVIIAGCLILGDLYLNARRVATDHRNAAERQGICGIIDQFPAGANVRIDQARADFRCPIPTAAPSQRPTPARRPKVRVTVTVTPRPVITPGPSRLIVTPGPTVTVTQRPPRHKHRKQHRTPTPTPTPTCTSVQLGGMCLP